MAENIFRQEAKDRNNLYKKKKKDTNTKTIILKQFKIILKNKFNKITKQVKLKIKS